MKLTCFGDIISIDKHTRFVNERNGSPSHKITGSIADESREKWPKTHLTLALQIRQQYTNLTAKVIEQFHSKGAIQGRRLIDRNFHVMRTVKTSMWVDYTYSDVTKGPCAGFCFSIKTVINSLVVRTVSIAYRYAVACHHWILSRCKPLIDDTLSLCIIEDINSFWRKPTY